MSIASRYAARGRRGVAERGEEVAPGREELRREGVGRTAHHERDRLVDRREAVLRASDVGEGRRTELEDQRPEDRGRRHVAVQLDAGVARGERFLVTAEGRHREPVEDERRGLPDVEVVPPGDLEDLRGELVDDRPIGAPRRSAARRGTARTRSSTAGATRSATSSAARACECARSALPVSHRMNAIVVWADTPGLGPRRKRPVPCRSGSNSSTDRSRCRNAPSASPAETRLAPTRRWPSAWRPTSPCCSASARS